MKKLIPPFLLIILASIMMVLHYSLPFKIIIFPPFNYFGLIFILLGFWIAQKVSDHFSRIGTEIHTFKRPRYLVTNGFFKYSRNPIYFSFAAILIGLGILLGSLSVFIVVIAFVIISDIFYIPFEEKNMEQEFGEEYRNYKKKVRRWL